MANIIPGLGALGQWFGGLRRPSYKTPPFQGGGNAKRGAIPGTPAAPTPGMPQPSLPAGGVPTQAGAPGAPVQPPAQAGGVGSSIWNVLNNPSVGLAGLAAGQQLTRARYPGESGMANAVGAVTAGYNALGAANQQRYAREMAEREAKLKADKAFQDAVESNARIKEGENRSQRRDSETTQGQQEFGLKTQEQKRKELKDVTDAMDASEGRDIDRTKAENQQKYWESQIEQAKDQLEHNKNRLAEDIRNHDLIEKRSRDGTVSQAQYQKAQIRVQEARNEVMRERTRISAAGTTKDPTLLQLHDRAFDEVMAQERTKIQSDPRYKASSEAEINAKVAERRATLGKELKSAQPAAQVTPVKPAWALPTDAWNPATGEVKRNGPKGWVTVTQ